MTVRFSTGLRDDMLNSVGFTTSLNDGVLNVYSGVQPASANSAAQGTLLLTITESGGAFTPGSPTNGLGFDAASGGVITKAAAETWQGNGLATGLAGWARFSGNATDAGGASTTLSRIDLSIAQSGGDLNLSNTSIVSGSPTSVGVFQVTMLEA